MSYRLRGRLTQEGWWERRAAGLLTEEEIEYFRRAGSYEITANDLKFLKDIKALDWDLAPSMMFQHLINTWGTEEEKDRLEQMRVGYRRTAITLSQNRISPTTGPMDLNQCACGERVVSMITDIDSEAHFCFHCAPEETNAVKVTRKLHSLFMVGKLDEAHYPLDERLRNLRGDWS
jgi:hypothetical protein